MKHAKEAKGLLPYGDLQFNSIDSNTYAILTY